jgi:hypothetical protein
MSPLTNHFKGFLGWKRELKGVCIDEITRTAFRKAFSE